MRWLGPVLLLLLVTPALSVGGSGDEVLVARIDGVVGRGTSIYIANALEEAERRGVPLLIELDTPGGLVDATLDMDALLADADVPVLMYVGPSRGAYAASAGTFLLMMGQPNGMADGTTIGSAQPVNVGAGGAEPASEKVENFLVERIRAIADFHGRDPDIAETYIRDNLNQDADEALRTGMVDVVAPSTRDFLDAVHGMRAQVGEDSIVLDTQDARIVRYEPGTLSKTIDLLSDPTLAFVLMTIGLYTLIYGLANPGTYVPETIGAILLLLGLIGLGLFGVTTAGFLLLVLAFVFFIAEVFTPTHGILSIAGVVTLIFAVLFLVDGPLLPVGLQQRLLTVGVTLAFVTGGVVFAAVTLALRTRNRPTTALDIGAVGHAIDPIHETGRVEVWGEVWDATSKEPIEAGRTVHVVKRKGLVLEVEPGVPPEAPEDRAQALAGADPEPAVGRDEHP